MTDKRNVNLVQSKDIAIGERIKKENLSKPIKDFLEETKKEQEILDIGLKMSRQIRQSLTAILTISNYNFDNP